MHEIRATFIMKTDAVSEGFRKPFLKPYIGRGPTDNRETREGAALRELGDHGAAQPRQRRGHRPAIGASSSVSPAKRVAEEAAAARRPFSRRWRDGPIAGRSPTPTCRCCSTSTTRAAPPDGFEAGIELALQRILVSPSFLFRTEFAPAAAAARAPLAARAYRISDSSSASRLSFFLWSSIPDDELLDLATQGKLHEPAVLERQTRRMLADPRSQAFTANFAGQWLSLRRLPDIVPDPFLFPDYGDTLALAFQREAELFFDSIVREDRPVLDLLDRQLHLRQRAAGAALRHPQREGHQLPARDAGRRQSAPRPARARAPS